MIARESEPENLEAPMAVFDEARTPQARFYVRSHFAVPDIDAKSWRLKVEGAVDRPFEIGLDELASLPPASKAALLECAGNGRVFLEPKAKGLLWESGAVGNAGWSGVPLAALLGRAGVRAGAVEVILEGADSGEIDGEPRTPGAIPYARSLPLEKAARDVLIALRMNGEALAPAHGFPARAVVPGWYGMASVKWLARVVVVDRPFAGYFQSLDYAIFRRSHGLPTLVALAENAVKAQVARPARGERIPRGEAYRVSGAAWAGEADVARVEVSVDGGGAWSAATLLGQPVRHAWRLWEWTWRAPDAAGPASVMARATDSRGRVQPSGRDPDLRGVMIHHVIPVEVEVEVA